MQSEAVMTIVSIVKKKMNRLDGHRARIECRGLLVGMSDGE